MGNQIKKADLIQIVVASVAALAAVVSGFVAWQQSRLTEQALDISLIQSRTAACFDAADRYAELATTYDAISPADFDQYGLPPDTPFVENGPNQLLEQYTHKSIAAGRALQLCLNSDGLLAISECVSQTVNIDDHRVDDDRPLDGILDALIC